MGKLMNDVEQTNEFVHNAQWEYNVKLVKTFDFWSLLDQILIVLYM